MKFSRILIANRGEIAIRIARAATDLGLHTVAIYSEDDARSLHTRMADEVHRLAGHGVSAYLDIDSVIQAAKNTQCEAIHPGYGFLAENGMFARRCQEAGLTFIGPAVELLELFGDKGRARAAAAAADVPIVRGINQAVSVDEAQDFFASLDPGSGMMIKAVAGGGGRGARAITRIDEIEAAYQRCQSEALSAFGNSDLYVEELIYPARHIEVQILGDLNGTVMNLGERDCSLQRRYQKMVEIAPAPNLPEKLRSDIIDAAMRLAKSVSYTNLGTIEFLVKNHPSAEELAGPDGTIGLPVPIQGTIVSVMVAEGDRINRGQPLAVLEAMKMEHVISADHSGTIRRVTLAVGDVIREGYPLFFIETSEGQTDVDELANTIDLDYIRPDLEETYQRHACTSDENRPEAVARRRKTGQRTARENIADLCDPDTFFEYGALAVAAQRSRRDEEWLRKYTPADGLLAGVGTVNGELFEGEDARCIAIAYDYTVLAGTQGMRNHYKKDRMFQLADRYQLPIVVFTEGGGGRPGDTDGASPVGMDVYTFTQFSKLSGLVPLVGVNSGRCFAGNTALLASCDVIIATANSTIAMGGPAMIEGGGLGIYTPEEDGLSEGDLCGLG